MPNRKRAEGGEGEGGGGGGGGVKQKKDFQWKGGGGGGGGVGLKITDSRLESNQKHPTKLNNQKLQGYKICKIQEKRQFMNIHPFLVLQEIKNRDDC